MQIHTHTGRHKDRHRSKCRASQHPTTQVHGFLEIPKPYIPKAIYPTSPKSHGCIARSSLPFPPLKKNKPFLLQESPKPRPDFTARTPSSRQRGRPPSSTATSEVPGAEVYMYYTTVNPKPYINPK